MAKKKAASRKSNGAAGIQTIENDEAVSGQMAEELSQTRSDEATTTESNGRAERKSKAKSDSQGGGSFGVGEIRKAAQFANSVGGLDKAIALLQILKVAKEVQ